MKNWASKSAYKWVNLYRYVAAGKAALKGGDWNAAAEAFEEAKGLAVETGDVSGKLSAAKVGLCTSCIQLNPSRLSTRFAPVELNRPIA